MYHREKKAFLKFFVAYFVSVGLLILSSGFFYFEQISAHILKDEEFSIIEYARHIKMNENLESFSSQYSHTINHKKEHINISNFVITKDRFIKLIPLSHNRGYIEASKSKEAFDREIMMIRVKIIAIQIALLMIFGYISYRLAKSAIKPFQESISTLDKFAKDLIHDLNTPVTSIKLNMKLIEKIPQIKEHKALMRLNRSVDNISNLHENLTILLQEKTFQLESINLCEIVEDIVEVQRVIYPNIDFQIECNNFKAKLNANATKQILQNIILNACKYNIKDGYIKIYHNENRLYIEDSGKGIKEPQNIFNRDYSTGNSSGIGLDIVKRLAKAMNIDVAVVANSKRGVSFILTMN